MDLFFKNYIICGVFITVLIFLLRRCYNAYNFYSKFPILHLLPYLVEYHFKVKPTNTISFGGFILENLLFEIQQHKKEGIVLAYILHPFMIVYREETAKVFLSNKVTYEKSPEYSIFELVLGEGLITSNGNKWKKHKRIVNPVFHLGLLKHRVSYINEYASSLVKELQTQYREPSFDLLPLIKYHYYCVLKESVFGMKPNEETKAENLNYLRIFNELFLNIMFFVAQPWWNWKVLRYITASGRQFFRMRSELASFTRNIITEMEKLLFSDKPQNSGMFSENLKHSLTYFLLQHRLKDPSFTLEDIHEEVTAVMAAGYHSVTNATMWCIFMLGLNPDVQEKAFNEVSSLPQEYVSYEECCQLTYLEAVLMETLRLFPIVPFFGRKTSHDVQLGKNIVPEGTNITFSAFLLHRDPNVYPNPEKFDPDRFLNKGTRYLKSHIPFAEGTRPCMGKKYALLEMKIFLAYILRKFRITTLDRREDVILCWNTLLTPDKPLRIRISPRSEKTSVNETKQ